MRCCSPKRDPHPALKGTPLRINEGFVTPRGSVFASSLLFIQCPSPSRGFGLTSCRVSWRWFHRFKQICQASSQPEAAYHDDLKLLSLAASQGECGPKGGNLFGSLVKNISGSRIFCWRGGGGGGFWRVTVSPCREVFSFIFGQLKVVEQHIQW